MSSQHTFLFSPVPNSSAPGRHAESARGGYHLSEQRRGLVAIHKRQPFGRTGKTIHPLIRSSKHRNIPYHLLETPTHGQLPLKACISSPDEPSRDEGRENGMPNASQGLRRIHTGPSSYNCLIGPRVWNYPEGTHH